MSHWGYYRDYWKNKSFSLEKKVLFVFARNREKRSSNRIKMFDGYTGLFGSVWDHFPVMPVWEKPPFVGFLILSLWLLFILLHSHQNNLSVREGQWQSSYQATHLGCRRPKFNSLLQTIWAKFLQFVSAEQPFSDEDSVTITLTGPVSFRDKNTQERGEKLNNMEINYFGSCPFLEVSLRDKP